MRRYGLVLATVAMVLGSGCQATGMGWIPSADLVPGDKATFGFVFDGTTMTFSGSYHDPQGHTALGVVDVALKGTGVVRPCKAGEPACAQAPALGAKGGCLQGNFVPYTSQNPNIPGSGTLDLTVCDSNGDFSTLIPDDFILIFVEDGPYTGYFNSGSPQGNISIKF